MGCETCGTEDTFLFACSHCEREFCSEHSDPADHDCPSVEAVEADAHQTTPASPDDGSGCDDGASGGDDGEPDDAPIALGPAPAGESSDDAAATPPESEGGPGTAGSDAPADVDDASRVVAAASEADGTAEESDASEADGTAGDAGASATDDEPTAADADDEVSDDAAGERDGTDPGASDERAQRPVAAGSDRSTTDAGTDASEPASPGAAPVATDVPVVHRLLARGRATGEVLSTVVVRELRPDSGPTTGTAQASSTSSADDGSAPAAADDGEADAALDRDEEATASVGDEEATASVRSPRRERARTRAASAASDAADPGADTDASGGDSAVVDDGDERSPVAALGTALATAAARARTALTTASSRTRHGLGRVAAGTVGLSRRTAARVAPSRPSSVPSPGVSTRTTGAVVFVLLIAVAVALAGALTGGVAIGSLTLDATVSDDADRADPSIDPETVEEPLVEQAIHSELRAARTDAGSGSTTADRRLAEIAAYHSEDMAEHDYVGAESPTGETLEDRFEAFDYTCSSPGQAVQWIALDTVPADEPDPEAAVGAAVVEHWLDSPEHERFLTREDASRIGVGVSVDGDRAYVSFVTCLR